VKLLNKLKPKICHCCSKKLGMYFKFNQKGKFSWILCSSCFPDSSVSFSIVGDFGYRANVAERELRLSGLAKTLEDDYKPPDYKPSSTADLFFDEETIGKAAYESYGGVWALHDALLKNENRRRNKNSTQIVVDSPEAIAASTEIDRLLQEAIEEYPFEHSAADTNMGKSLTAVKNTWGPENLLRVLKTQMCHKRDCPKLGMYFSRPYRDNISQFTCTSCFNKDGGWKLGYGGQEEDRDWTPKQAEQFLHLDGRLASTLQYRYKPSSLAQGQRAVFSGSASLYSDQSVSHAAYETSGGVWAMHYRLTGW
jgi:hypothetical protein